VRGCLFTVALAAVVMALIVVVGLPAVAAGLLTAGVRAGGLQASDTVVTVTADPPWDLLELRATRVRVRATHATFRGLQIGALDVTLLDVSVLGRTAGAVGGRLTGVTVPDVAGQPLALGAIDLGGGGGRVTASTTIAAGDARALVAAEIAAVTGVDVPATAVRLAAPDKVVVKDGLTVTARLSVDAAGNVVATAPDIPAVTLLRAGEDVPITFTSVRVVDAAGDLALAGTLSVGLLGG
jgi:hypothetical protein